MKLKEGWRSAVFWKAGVRRASRLGFACIPIATGGQDARNANRVTLPLEYYEAARDKKLIDFQAAAANIRAA